uniref:Uncharacterized protein n=1 Tax=Timema monikensis TaxID=170555 RepID=A0A7R9HQ93_9NEOP|nr:unnamed protein product [Timema monikensis]
MADKRKGNQPSRLTNRHRSLGVTLLDLGLCGLGRRFISTYLVGCRSSPGYRGWESCRDHLGIRQAIGRPPGNPREHMKSLDKQVKLKRKLELQEYVEAQEASMEHRRAIFKSQCLGLCEAKRNMKEEIKRLKLEGENIKNTLGDVGNMLEYPIMDLDKDKENTHITHVKQRYSGLVASLVLTDNTQLTFESQHLVILRISFITVEPTNHNSQGQHVVFVSVPTPTHPPSARLILACLKPGPHLYQILACLKPGPHLYQILVCLKPGPHLYQILVCLKPGPHLYQILVCPNPGPHLYQILACLKPGPHLYQILACLKPGPHLYQILVCLKPGPHLYQILVFPKPGPHLYQILVCLKPGPHFYQILVCPKRIRVWACCEPKAPFRRARCWL